MRDIISCFSEESLSFSNPSSSCSFYTSTKNSLISPFPPPISVKNEVCCLYKTTLLSDQTHLLITVSWFTTYTGHRVANLNLGHCPSISFPLSSNLGGFFRKNKKHKTNYKKVEREDSIIEVFWDLSKARYETNAGPEPVNGFYLVVVIDSQVGLVLGDASEQEFISKNLRLRSNNEEAASESRLILRTEHFSGDGVYAAKAWFGENGGVSHDVLIKCSGGSGEDVETGTSNCKHPVLSVYVDKKMVLRAKRLQWNFRGSQTIFVGGLAVDLMWNVHDWFFSTAGVGAGCATFMFRTRRSGTLVDGNCRFWQDDQKRVGEEEFAADAGDDFTLVIRATRSKSKR